MEQELREYFDHRVEVLTKKVEKAYNDSQQADEERNRRLGPAPALDSKAHGMFKVFEMTLSDYMYACDVQAGRALPSREESRLAKAWHNKHH